MSWTCNLRVLLCLFIGLLLSFINSQEYRIDYEYNEETDAFYKLHIETAREWASKRVCELEGGSLMAPTSHQDIVQVHRMFKRFPDLGEYVRVKDDGQEHESAEEPAIIIIEPQRDEYSSESSWGSQCNVITRSGEIETVSCHHNLPFVCKVNAREAPYDRECNVHGKGYIKGTNVSSCYKIPKMPFTWNQAYAECSAEGAHLVVLNSQAEHDYVHELMNTRRGSVEGAKASWFFFAGFRAEPTRDGALRVFKTIFNETLEQAGYSTWADNEPNNSLDNENCGSIFKNDGKLNDVDCSDLYGFICEKEVPSA